MDALVTIRVPSVMQFASAGFGSVWTNRSRQQMGNLDADLRG